MTKTAPASGARVLDVGFGGGYTLERLAAVVGPARVRDVELSEAARVLAEISRA